MPSQRRAIRGLSLPLLAVVLLMAGCGRGGAEAAQGIQSDAPPVSMDASAEVSEESGLIVLPVERYLLSDFEYQLLDNARGLAMSKCAQEHGVELAWSPSENQTVSDRRYGVWVPADAESYGYAVPEAVAVDDTSTGTTSESDFTVFEQCSSSDDTVASFNYERIRPGFNYAEELGWITDDAFSSSAGEAVFADWERCLNEHGLQRDTSVSAFAVQGAGLDITEQNIQMALTDVSCKSEVDFVQRLADIEAVLQGPVVAEHLDELSEMRHEYDTMVEAAQEYLASNAPSG